MSAMRLACALVLITAGPWTAGCCEPSPLPAFEGGPPPDVTIEARSVVIDGVPANLRVRKTTVDGGEVWPVEVALGDAVVSFSTTTRPVVTVLGREVRIDHFVLVFSMDQRSLVFAGTAYPIPAGAALLFGGGRYLGRVR